MDLHIEEWTVKKLQIVETIITKVALHGFVNVSTAKIAKEAGVGEGTIYRHFQSKEELINIAAEYAGQSITKNIRKNHNPGAQVEVQFASYCSDFMKSIEGNEGAHRYLMHYINTPQGLAYRKAMFSKIDKDPALARPFFFPLNMILAKAREEGRLKDMPLQVHGLMTISSLVFLGNDVALGLVTLDKELITSIARACWDAIKI
ncbi:TetR/AcrR family transcriptional regulator [Desulforhopalus sp. 52FAK]